MAPLAGDMNSPPMQYSVELCIHQQPMSPPDRYPVPDSGFHGEDNATFHFYGNKSVEEKKEILEITQNSLDILSSILNSETEPKPIKDDLTISMLEKCKEALPVVQRIVESTTDDEVMLFEALNLNEELQQIIFKYEEMVAAQSPGRVPPKNSDSAESNLTVPVGTQRDTAKADSGKEERTASSKGTQKPDVPKTERTEPDIL